LPSQNNFGYQLSTPNYQLTMATKTTNEFLGTGRRKTAVARVRLATGSGKITVNRRTFENYFPLETLRAVVIQPLTVAGALEKFDVRVNVAGGGPNGQADAVRHGISRALIKFDAALRPPLKAEGLLTRDPRMRERKKYGQPGARKRFQFSKR
jgi:small subunit ribosomal protein S9